MRTSPRTFVLVALCCALSTGAPEAAFSGDPNGDGTTSVADGVLTLRAAAELASPCDMDACDVDGSGSITVTDGVHVLRTVAGLPAAMATASGGAPRGVQSPVVVHFRFAAAAALEGYRVDVAYPLGKGGFDGSADGVACTASGGAIFVGNDRDDGTMILIEADAFPITFPREIACIFQQSPGATLAAADLGVTVVEVVENGSAGDVGDLQVEIRVGDEPPTPCKDGAWRFTTAPGGTLDVGWTGLGHGLPLPSHTSTGIPLDCSAGDDACALDGAGLVGVPAGAPVPLSAGGVPQCVVPYFRAAPTGTVDCTTGCSSAQLPLRANVYLVLEQSRPCPICVGDGYPGDGFAGGICEGGATPGAPCDVHGITSRHDAAGPDYGRTSRDCLPAGSLVGELAIDLSPLHTGTTVVEADIDCALDRPGSGRCYCPGQLQANGCPNGKCPSSGFCEDVVDGVCDRLPFFACRPGTGTADCDDVRPGAGTCIVAPRPCFGSSIARTGTCGTDQSTLVSVFCVPPTQAAAINVTLGLPGPAAASAPIAFGPVSLPQPSASPPAPSPQPTPAAPRSCTGTPRADCHALVRPHAAALAITDRAHGTDELVWRFTGGTETGIFEFGNPFVQTAYALCLYGPNGVLFESHASPTDVCRRSQSCWRGTAQGAWRYTNHFGNADGVTRVDLQPGLSGAARVTFKARGKRIALPGLPLPAPFTVQLQGSDASCWAATYEAEDVVKNGLEKVRAVTKP